MEEDLYGFAYRLLIVYECFHDLCCTMDWNKFIISNGGWYETRGLCRHEDFITCGTDTDGKRFAYIHNDDKGVVFYHIPMKGIVCLHYLDAEEWGVKKFIGFTNILFMRCFVFRIDSVVYGLCRQFSM